MEPSTTSAGFQTDTFGEVIDMLSQKDIAIEKLMSTKEINFIPENIRDDTQMKCVTSFTIKEFYCIYKFLMIEDDLSMGTKRRPIDRPELRLKSELAKEAEELPEVWKTKPASSRRTTTTTHLQSPTQVGVKKRDRRPGA
ncbi:hypothetical protein TNIN_428861 [Trichonephila inaurata madagascariensis]|uniref:Uncharacterized protein n=1 Tax=Trichonephila inaurata madagascariensis TaxID=2747483 RepID=A0A8X6IUK7_9ARAC|nr:hypothetical protein TNIN_428861 [Trichonephila inaurata madagascariensis]